MTAIPVKSWTKSEPKTSLLSQEQVNKIKPLLDELAPRLNAYLRSIGPLKKREIPDSTDHGQLTTDNI